MDIKVILNRKKAIKSSLTRLKNKTVEDIKILNLDELEVRKDRFDSIGGELKTIFDNLFGLAKDEEVDAHIQEYQDLLETLDEMVILIKMQIRQLGKREDSVFTPSQSHEAPDIKLPTLSLPTFSGAVEEWLTFSDLFQAAVTNNQNLTGAQKLQYLKGVVKGDAQRVIQSLSICDANFQIALDLLKERYFHKREIMASLMKKFLNIPPITNESHVQILKLVDSAKEYVRLLETLDLNIKGAADTILMFIIQFKLDLATRGWWERSLTSDKIPSLDELLQFLSNHARSLMGDSQGVKRNSCSKRVTLVASEFQTQCVYCRGSHMLSKCDAFLKLSVQNRVNFVKSNNVCFNCLTQFHRKVECKSPHRCRKCKQSHHTVLHFENVSEPRYKPARESAKSGLSPLAQVFEPVTVDPNKCETVSGSVKDSSGITSCSGLDSNSQVLLCTALINVTDSCGGVQVCRALLDPGSQACLITNACLERLGLPKRRGNVRISCLGVSHTRTNGISDIKFTPHFSDSVSFVATVHVVNKIVGQLPHCSLDSSCSEPFSDLKLADPTFFKSGPIDILLGVNVALPLLKGQSLSVGEGKLFAVRSELGWIVAGTAPSQDAFSSIQVNNIEFTSELVKNFWELDSVPSVSLMTPEERACEEHFVSNHVRDNYGRYVVKLPFRSTPLKLGNSRETALRRFKRLEHSLSSKPTVYEQYRDFMREYLALGHMELVPESDYAKGQAYYLPHHAVLRDSSTTTKLRVVFDASAKSASGYSLNDLLMVGPRVQRDLYSILLSFRTFHVVVCADLEKMFRQIKVSHEDTDWQRILWRDNPEEQVKEFRLLTVTYGTSSAPYLSTRTLNQLALDESENYPVASSATLRNFYVDDLLGGATTEEKAVELVRQLKEMMRRGGFHLRKWKSNIESVIQEVSNDQDLSLVPTEDVKILGIKWNPKKDCFSFSVALSEEKLAYSKRDILSEIARVFDPLGLVSPCIVFMKILLQELWKSKLEWDLPIPRELNEKWMTFRKELRLLEDLKIPRCVLQPYGSSSAGYEIHAFCDASEKAYCAVIYLKSIAADSRIFVSLLTSKTRVAPLKTQSLPRLELCAALLLSNVLSVVLEEIQLPIERAVAWTDSMITLAWLSSEPYRWHTFVANRVAKIQATVPFVKWLHVAGTDNPADLGTRGLMPAELLKSPMWLEGPPWLREPMNESTAYLPPDKSVLERERLEEKKADLCVNSSFVLPEFISAISSFTKLIRVCAWIKRFLYNSGTKTARRYGPLSSSELYSATSTIVRVIQETEFAKERKLLAEGKPLPSTSRLLPLNVFLDEDNLLRVGGRISKHSSLAYDHKHPMLLPKCHVFTYKVIEYYHCVYLHAGPRLTLSLIREKFWFVDGRSVVRNQLRKCVKCFKLNLKSSPQLMGDLPRLRIEQVRPFWTLGIDFAGPIVTKCAHKRSVAKFKSYICLFICFTTKAIHLELVSDLTTAAFLAALRRFISRRGCPAKIVTDNGSNFRGAARHLKVLCELCRSNQVQDFIAMKGIDWSFIPPYTPHFGGLWESGIKSAKRLLAKTCNSALLNFEELSTVLHQIEACLNSRPLTELSSDPSDLNAITPAHFLIGGPLNQFPEPVQPTQDICVTERWRLIQRLRQQFWERWTREYLHELQPRSKWWKSNPNIKVGDMVIVQRDNVAPLNWDLGRVTRLIPGADGKVRVVTAITRHGEITRSVNKIYLLPISISSA